MPRKPDYDVAALHKDSNQKGQIGAAWKNPDGTISIVLDQFIKVEQTGDLLVTLFPKIQKRTPINDQVNNQDDAPF